MLLTLILGCVFLGIKSVEYYGKFDHDILPGHIPRITVRRWIRSSTIRDTDGSTSVGCCTNGKTAESKRWELDSRVKSLSRKQPELPKRAKIERWQRTGQVKLRIRQPERARSGDALSNGSVRHVRRDPTKKKIHQGNNPAAALDEVNHKVEELTKIPSWVHTPVDWCPLIRSFLRQPLASNYFLMTDSTRPRDHRPDHVHSDSHEGGSTEHRRCAFWSRISAFTGTSSISSGSSSSRFFTYLIENA